jgi:AraC-like DNA-binding protein
MLTPPVTISVALVHGMLSGLQARGLPYDAILADAGIPPELLREASARVTAAQYVALFRLLIETRDDEMLGFLSRPLKRGSFALIARSALSAPDLETAFRRIARTFRLLQEDVVLEQVRKDSLAGLALRFTDPAAPVFLHELLLRVYWRLLAWLAGGQLPVACFDFAYPHPLHAASYGAIFPAELNFGQHQSAFWFDALRLQQPVRRDEAALRAFLAEAQSNIITPRRGGDVTSMRVRSQLQATLPVWPDLAAIADALHMSTATLQRRLAAEGTSFQALKDELRRDMAIVRLNTSAVPLAALAEELGFTDSTAFQRAFKSWTGSAPGTYRRGGM